MDEPSVKVTLADIYAEVVKTGRDVVELRGDIKNLITDSQDHEDRIRSLEKSTITKKGAYTLTAVIGVLASVAAFFVDLGRSIIH